MSCAVTCSIEVLLVPLHLFFVGLSPNRIQRRIRHSSLRQVSPRELVDKRFIF